MVKAHVAHNPIEAPGSSVRESFHSLRNLRLFPSFRGYEAAWLRYDLAAGLAIAAVGLPIAIAYPAIAKLPPEVGLYASIVPLVAYALLGSSRQLIVGPDAATITMLAAVLLSLNLSSTDDRIVVSAAIAVIVGVLCFLASVLRLGFIANFLSRPILTGFMTGISLTIMVGQIGRFTSVKIDSEGLIRPLVELATKAALIHWPSVALGTGLFILLRLLGKWLPAIPGPLVAMVLATALSAALDFPAMGIGVVGEIPSRLPSFVLPIPQGVPLDDLILGAGAVLIVSFGSGIVTARSFGAKNKYPVDANNELVGFGAANLASGLFSGFPVTATDSRTAVNDMMGGKTQLAGIVAAAALALTVLFLTDALSVLPTPALGAVLASAALSLIDLRTLRELWRISYVEFLFALISIVGVISVGVLKGVVVAMGATLLYLLMKGLRPRDAMLGRIPGRDGYYKLHRYQEAQPIPGLAIYLLQGNLLFYNADYVKGRLEALISRLAPGTQWLIFDASVAAHIDSTATAALEDACALAKARGVKFGIVELHSEPFETLKRAGVLAKIGDDMIFDALEDVTAAFSALPARS